MYTEKFDEFQKTLNKSNDVFKTFKKEMDKVGNDSLYLGCYLLLWCIFFCRSNCMSNSTLLCGVDLFETDLQTLHF